MEDGQQNSVGKVPGTNRSVRSIMSIYDRRSLLYALRCVHLADTSPVVISTASEIGISSRVLEDMKIGGLIKVSAGKVFTLTDFGREKLSELGGPYPNWERRRAFA